jgi:DNA-binding beta-propeller fold protein YncE
LPLFSGLFGGTLSFFDRFKKKTFSVDRGAAPRGAGVHGFRFAFSFFGDLMKLNSFTAKTRRKCLMRLTPVKFQRFEKGAALFRFNSIIVLLALAFFLFDFVPRLEAQPHFSFDSQWGKSGKEKGQFNGPHALALGPDGSVYVGDIGNQRVQKIFPGGEIEIWALDKLVEGSNREILKSVTSGVVENSNPELGSPTGTNNRNPFDLAPQSSGPYRIKGEAVRWNFSNPFSIALDGRGEIYLADPYRMDVRKFSFGGGPLRTIGSYGDSKGQTHQPCGIAVDSARNVLVSDTDLHKIVQYDSRGRFILEIGKKGGENGEFSSPHGVAADAAGNIYVADTGNNRVQKFDSKGIFLRAWGGGGHEKGRFYRPMGIAVDSLKRVYVTDAGNNRVEVFDDGGKFLTQFGDHGKFREPAGVAVGPDGAVYVADFGHNRVQKWVPDRGKP